MHKNKLCVIMDADMREVKLESDGQRELEFEGVKLMMTRMEPVSWFRWIDGSVEKNVVFLPFVNYDDDVNDVDEYFTRWCRESGTNSVSKVRRGRTEGALVQFANSVGKPSIWQDNKSRIIEITQEPIEGSMLLFIFKFRNVT